MDKDSTSLTIIPYFMPLQQQWFQAYAREHGLDRYTKKMDSLALIQLMVFAQLAQLPSYGQIALHLRKSTPLQQVLDLSSISVAQLSRRWRDLDPTVLADVFASIVRQIARRFGTKPADPDQQVLHIIDASTISLCLSQFRWATLSKFKSGVKLHVRFNETPDVAYPDQVVLSEASRNDKLEMESLVIMEPDAWNVFDRGYIDYRKFDEYSQEGVRFVTRLRRNADVQILEERPGPPGTNILREATIRLGPRNTRYVMQHALRLIECRSPEGESILLITNDFERSAEHIAQTYRRRWQIELFFKWMKQHLHVKVCYGTSRNAVYNQLYTALIAYGLSLLMQKQVSHRGSLWEFVRHLRFGWSQRLNRFIQDLFRAPERPSTGRRRQPDVERIYQETMHQYDSEEADHLDDMTLGPLFV